METQHRFFVISHDNSLSHIILVPNIIRVVKNSLQKSICETKNQALLLPVGYFSLAVCDF